MIEKRRNGIIHRCKTGAFRYHAWGTVARLTDGTLAAACSGGRIWHICPFGKSMLFLSRDEGKTWSSPIVVNDTWMDDRDVGLTALPDGGLMMSWFSMSFALLDKRKKMLDETYSDGEKLLVAGYRSACVQNPADEPGSFLRVSHDGGLSWGETIRVSVSAPHGPIVLADGSLLYFGKKTESFAERVICALRSTDGGRTWQELGHPPLPEHTAWSNFYEPHAVQLPSGRIVGAIRYESTPKHHFESYEQLTMFVTASDDGGKTWSMPRCLGVSGSPPHLMCHSSGALLLSYGRREDGKENRDLSERVLISWDDGETWTEDLAIFADAPDWDLGYPSTVELSDGSLLTAYYQKYEEDGRVDPKASFLYTTWTLKEGGHAQ